MPLLFSRSCEYALQAVLYLAQESQGKPVVLQEISTALNIPYHFLSKVLQVLTRDGIVSSYKGPNGGFALGRAASEISLVDIVRAIDGEAFLEGCVLGFSSCSEESPCPVHHSWKQAKEIMHEMLRDKTIAELSAELKPKLTLIEQLSQ